MSSTAIDLEMAVLAAVCSDSYLLTKALDEGFHPNLLHSPPAKILANALLVIRNQGAKAMDPLLLRSHLESQDLLAPQVSEYLDAMGRCRVLELNQLISYLELLKERASRERLLQLASRIDTYARHREAGQPPVVEFTAGVLQELLDIQKQRLRKRLRPVEDIVRQVTTAVEQRPKGTKTLLGHSVSPFNYLNSVLSGLRPGFYYGLAGGRKQEALDMLKKAQAAGYRDLDWIARDPELACLHSDPEFQRLIEEGERKG